MKRAVYAVSRPRSRGRVSPIRKNSSHLTVSLRSRRVNWVIKLILQVTDLASLKTGSPSGTAILTMPEFVQEDNKLRKEIQKSTRKQPYLNREIDRQGKDVTITLHTARPGIVIGRGGQRVDETLAIFCSPSTSPWSEATWWPRRSRTVRSG